MSFGEQVKRIREERNLTQEQMADRLNVTRQAVSNWENDRNLPDIEMLITMASVFRLSLDQLVLGEDAMNNMTEKLIQDGSETRRAKMNLIGVCVGAALLVLGGALLAIKAVSVEYIDTAGVLHENFFLLPLAFLFLFCGFIAFLVTGIRNAVAYSRHKSSKAWVYAGISAGVVLLNVGAVLMLLAGNAGAPTGIPGAIVAACGMACLLLVMILPRLLHKGD